MHVIGLSYLIISLLRLQMMVDVPAVIIVPTNDIFKYIFIWQTFQQTINDHILISLSLYYYTINGNSYFMHTNLGHTCIII